MEASCGRLHLSSLFHRSKCNEIHMFIIYIFLISVRFPSQKEPYEGLLWFILSLRWRGSMSCHPFTLVVIKMKAAIGIPND